MKTLTRDEFESLVTTKTPVAELPDGSDIELTMNQAIAIAEKARRSTLLKKASNVRLSSTSATYHYNIKPKRWDEIARLTAAGRSVERIALYLNMPEWIVKILVQHIAMTNTGHGTAAQNLEKANRVIKATNMRVQR